MTKSDLYTILSHAPNTRVVNLSELCTRCFLCGDSVKNPNKKRLYIRINQTDPREPVLYHCFNCMAKGILTTDMLREMGVDDAESFTFIKRLNHDAMSDDGKRVNRYKNTKEIQVEIPPIMGTPQTLTKIKYLYDRIGYKIPIEDFNKLKIILNLKEFLDFNKIPPINKHVDLLDRDYVGFLSTHNEYVILRDITGQNNMRYVKYNIFNVVDNSQSFYAPRASIDLLTTEDIHIIVNEGPFDTLSIIYNVYNGDIDNKIFLATCNGSFTAPILHFIRKGLVGENIHIDCYQDNDTKLNFKTIKRQLNQYTPRFKVYYNRLYKDFGVPKDMIDVDEVIL